MAQAKHKEKFKTAVLNSKQLEVPRTTYQRKLNPAKVKKIVEQFDERLVNEPKVSLREGHYYIFDGQHTVAALVTRNGNKELPIRCKIYFDLTEQDEALLFAKQNGISSPLSPGIKLRANAYGRDPEAIAFIKATESAGLIIDYDQKHGKMRLGCIGSALDQFRRVGEEHYKEGLMIIISAWDGDPESLRAEIISGIMQFIDLYHDEYKPKRLIERLKLVDPLTIYREGRAMGVNLAGNKKYLYQVFQIYNGGSKNNSLPIKF